MADVIYDSLRRDLMRGSVNLYSDTIKCLLVTSDYVPNPAHAKRSDITNEVMGQGYSAGGIALANKTVDDSGVFDADDAVWPVASIKARGAVLYKSREGKVADDELIQYIDFGEDVVSTNDRFFVEFHEKGILQLNG